MTTATAPEEQTSELTPAQAEAQEEAGFNSTTVLPTGPDTDTPVVDEAVTPSSEPAVASPVEPDFKSAQISEEAFQKLLAKATEVDEIKAAIEQRYNGLGGKIGGIERFLSELKAGSGKKVEISKDDLKELFDEEDGFPQFGEKALLGLNRALAKISVLGGSTMTPEQLDTLLSEREAHREIVRLDRKQPDWRDTVGLPDPVTKAVPDTDYRRWLATQPDDYQQDIKDSVSAREIAESITQFKEFKTSQAQKPKTPTEPKTPAVTERERELRRAVPLKGAGGSTLAAAAQDEEAAMAFAYEAERKRHS